MEENNGVTTAITDQINSLRSSLSAPEHLQIQPSGDYEQVRIKLDHDVQISFFFDALNNVNTLLTVNNVHDLRITKSTNKCPLNNDQWTNIRNYFDDLTHQSNGVSSIRSIIQLIQDHLSQLPLTTTKSKQKQKASAAVINSEELSTTTTKFRGADLIYNRILYDKTIDRSQVIIGYEDRFTGIHEIAFNQFKKVHNYEVL